MLSPEEFLKERTAGQIRLNGSPAWTHPDEVRKILINFGITDETVLAAALLHDIIEDTKTTLKEVETLFGKKIAKIVDELTIIFPDENSYEQNTFLAIERAAASSKEAQVIRLADRLHNLLTISAKTPKEQIGSTIRSLAIWSVIPDAVNPGLKAKVLRIILRSGILFLKTADD